MEKRLRKVRIAIFLFCIGWTGFLSLFSLWLKYRIENRAKDMLVLRLMDAIELYKNTHASGVKQDALDNLIRRQIHSFRIGRFGTIMHVKDHTIIAAADSSLNGQLLPDVEFPGGIEDGNFFNMNLHGEKHLAAMEKVDKMHIIGLLPYSEVYNNFYRCLIAMMVAVIASILSHIFLYRKIRGELLADGIQ